MQQLTARYEGRVQGVGFRATVVDIASRFQVVGQVRNRADGSVEMVAQGESAELVQFGEAIRRRMERNIARHNEDWQELSQVTFSQFSIAPSG